MLKWFFRLFRSSIPAPEAGQVWISMCSERCTRIADVSISDCGFVHWNEQNELRAPFDGLPAVVAMERRFNALPSPGAGGLTDWRRQVRRNHWVLLGSPEYLEAFRRKHGRNINPPPWFPRPDLSRLRTQDMRGLPQ
jgi:hypothetical protein